MVTPFASELVVWRRQLAQICALADPRCKKGAKQASRRPTNSSKTRKNTEKPAWKVPRKDPALKKSARALCEAAKTQGNIIDERRAPPKTGDGPQKKHERSNERHPTRKQRNTPDTGICARSLPPDGGPSSKLIHTLLYVLSF